MGDTRFTRRGFLARSAGLATGLLGASALLAACGGATPTPTQAPAKPAEAKPTTAPAAAAPTKAPEAAKAAAPTTAPAPAAKPAASTKQATVAFASNASPTAEEPVLNAVFKEFQTRNPNIKVNATFTPADQLREKLILQLAGGTAPDIFRQNDDEVKGIAAKGQVLELDPYMKTYGVNTDDYFPLAYDDVPRWEGKIYAVMTGGRPEAIFYNKKLLRDAGVPFPPKNNAEAWSWDEFRGHLPKLVKKDAGGKATSWAFAWEYWTFDRIGQMNGTEGLVKTDLSEFIMNQPKNVEVLNELQKLHKEGLAAPYGMWQDIGTGTMFVNGQLAMAVLHSSSQPDCIKAAREKGLDWDIAPWPKFKVKSLSCAYLDAFSVNKATPDREASTQAAFFLISDYAAERWMFGADPKKGVRGPTVPLLKKFFKDPRWLDPELPPTNAQLWEQQLNNDARFPESACYRELTQPMQPYMERIWNNQGDPQKEMDDLKPKVDAVLKGCVKEKGPRKI